MVAGVSTQSRKLVIVHRILFILHIPPPPLILQKDLFPFKSYVEQLPIRNNKMLQELFFCV
jgi:hypothetical protein